MDVFLNVIKIPLRLADLNGKQSRNILYPIFGRIPPLLSERSAEIGNKFRFFWLKTLIISKIYAIIDTQQYPKYVRNEKNYALLKNRTNYRMLNSNMAL